jgi:hypothetical protein
MEDYLFDDKLPSVTMVDYNSIGTEITIKSGTPPNRFLYSVLYFLYF